MVEPKIDLRRCVLTILSAGGCPRDPTGLPKVYPGANGLLLFQWLKGYKSVQGSAVTSMGSLGVGCKSAVLSPQNQEHVK